MEKLADLNEVRPSDAPPGRVFMRPQVKFEPLISGWYAWSYILPPVQLGMNLLHRYLPIMESFVENPSVHVAATRDPKMLGGPFIALPADAAPEVRRLMKDTIERCAEVIQMAKDYRALDEVLKAEMRGFCLDGAYERVPPSLRGLVELVYDVDHKPRARLLEAMIAEHGPDTSHLEEVALSLDRDETRAFFLSTPRVPSRRMLNLTLPFADPRIDQLADMRLHARDLGDVVGSLGLDETQAKAFGQLVTAEPPRRHDPEYSGDGVRVRYFGHAAVLVQTSEVSILIDPIITADGEGEVRRFTYADLPDRIDYLIISHCHQDHFAPEVLMQLRGRVGKVIVPRNAAGNIADPSMKRILTRLGFSNVEAVDVYDSIPLPGGEFVSIPFPGEHSDLDVDGKHSIFLRLKQKTLLFLVDSNAVDLELYKKLSARVRDVDVIFLGMECHGAPLTWLYGPLVPRPLSRRDDESRRLSGSDADHAFAAVQEIGCSKVFIYAMGQEPWLQYLMGLAYEPDSVQLTQADAFIASCRAEGVPAERLYGCRDLLI